jgi:hypothetical protein
MKPKTKALIALSILAALCIGFLIGISVKFTGTDRSELAGTFGKAEKYRKTQMTEKDVQLRSDLLSDTARLGSMIQGLVYFTLFTEEISTHIDSCVAAFKAGGMGSRHEEATQLEALQQYSDFIKNNNLSLQKTIVMLMGFYTGDSVDQSQDVEKNLRDFGAYVSRLEEMDSVLSASIMNMDNYMLGKDFQDRKDEIARLKSIRDQLLANSLQLAGVLNDKGMASSLLQYALSSQEKLFVLMDKPLSSSVLVGGTSKIAFCESKPALEAAYNSTQVSANFDYKSTNGLGIIYSVPQMQFMILDKAGLNIFYSSGSDFLGAYKAVAFIESGTLQVVLQNYSLQNVLQSNVLGVLRFNSLNSCGLTNMNAIIQSTAGLENIFKFIASQNLGLLYLTV